MTLSPEKAAIGKITAKPEQYIDAFNILLKTWIHANIRRIDRSDMLLICDELLTYEMPADFMLWYFDKSRTIVKFNKFNMFRQEHGDKIKAVNVIQQSHLPVATGTIREDMRTIEAADAFGPNPNGGRKKRTQHRRMRMRTRRQKRTRNRNPRK
jgi:hypothetical protein